MLNGFWWWLLPLLEHLPRVFGVPLILFICCPGYQNQCCVSNIGGWSLLYFLTIFPFWGFPPKSPQLTFPFWEVLRADFHSSLPKASRCSFSDPSFWLLHFLSFSLNDQIISYQTERSLATFLYGPPSCIPRGTRLLFMKCWFLSHQPFSKPWVANGTCLSSFLVSMSMLPWAVPIPANTFLHFSRILGFWES